MVQLNWRYMKIPFDLNHAVAVLKRTPDTLKALLYGLPEEWIRGNEGSETWSPFDVVGHLIHGEETDWIPRARIILRNEKIVTFDSFDRFAQLKRFRRTRPEDLLQTFATLRAENLTELDGMQLNPDKLDKKGRHPELGVVSLKQLIATWTVHDLGHIRQVSKAMAWQYVDEVGPWRAYLTYLDVGK